MKQLKSKIESLREKGKEFSVLYVEDEEMLREKVGAFFKKFFTNVVTAVDGRDGLEKYTQNRYDIVVTDIQMPNMSGLELIKEIRKQSEYQEIIVTSAYTDSMYMTECIELGVTGYIIKPIVFEQILSILNQSIYKLTAFHENEMYKHNLEKLVEQRTKTVVNLQNEQVENYQHAILSLVKMTEARDSYTGGHSERVAIYSRDIAKAMNLSEKECNIIYEAGILHDIGKIITPDAILLKPGRLTRDEYILIQDHVTAGYNILSEIPMYHDLAYIVHAHHERMDGSGYPRGIKADEIPLLSKIMMVADAFDAMTTNRIYKPRKSLQEALDELEKYSGVWYDKDVVEAAIKVLKVVELDNSINQIPASHIDDERFAYFYKDSLTKIYNHNYFDFILQKNKEDKKALCLNIFYLKNFSLYNKKHGWGEGDVFLQKFSDYLKKTYPDAIFFRIFGDDFAMLSQEHLEVDINVVNSIELFRSNELYCEHRHYHINEVDINSYKDLQD